MEGKGAVVRGASRLLCHKAEEEIGVEAAMDGKAVSVGGLLSPVEGVTPLAGIQLGFSWDAVGMHVGLCLGV